MKVAGWGSVWAGDGFCLVCGEPAVGEDSLTYALPMRDGKVDWNSDINFPCCRKCYEQFNKEVVWTAPGGADGGSTDWGASAKERR